MQSALTHFSWKFPFLQVLFQSSTLRCKQLHSDWKVDIKEFNWLPGATFSTSFCLVISCHPAISMGGPTQTWRRQSTEEVQKAFNERIQNCLEDLAAVTGEAEDVKKEKDFTGGTTCLTFQDVSFSTKTQRRNLDSTPQSDKSGTSAGSDASTQILAPISGHYEAGNLVALMGPSGSGKTTLLDILAGKKAPSNGTIHMNGRPRDHLWNRIAAYIPQEDSMFAHLTVEEVMKFHGDLKIARPSRITPAMAKRQLDQTLQVFGLSEVRSHLIGDPNAGIRGISGGQKRRLSVARTIACGAQIIFSDEPTSGLSATDAEQTMRYMRLIAHKHSVLIFTSIHQPRREVAKLFDELILLTSNPGRAVYQGPLDSLRGFMEKVISSPIPVQVNPTDFCMDLITPGTKSARDQEFMMHFAATQQPFIEAQVAEELVKQRQTSMETLQAAREPLKLFGLPPVRNSRYEVSFWQQLKIVAARQLLLRRRDKMHFLADVIGAIAKALVFVSGFYQIGTKTAAQQSGFFFLVLMACCTDQVKTMPKVISERTIMKMETAEALYNEWAYIIPFTLMSLVQLIIVHGLFVALIWPFMAYPTELLPHVWFWSLMVNTVMDSLYLMLSGIAKDATAAQVMSLPFLLIFMLYNGFTVTSVTCPEWLLWAIDISPVAYAMEAMTIAASEICVPDGPSCGEDGLYLAIVAHFGYKARPKQALMIMGILSLLFRGIHVIALKYLNNIRRWRDRIQQYFRQLSAQFVTNFRSAACFRTEASQAVFRLHSIRLCMAGLLQLRFPLLKPGSGIRDVN